MGEYLDQLGRRIVPSVGDGLCLLHAICDHIMLEDREVVTVEDVIQKVTQYLIENREQYIEWHGSQSVVEDLLTYFDSKNYNVDVMDLLWAVAARAMGITLVIYRNVVNCVNVMSVNEGHKEVHVVYGSDHYSSCPRMVIPTEEDQSEEVTSMDTQQEEDEGDTLLSTQADMFSQHLDDLQEVDLSQLGGDCILFGEEQLNESEKEEAAGRYMRGENAKGQRFPTEIFTLDDIKNVHRLPPNVDGYKIYRVKCKESN